MGTQAEVYISYKRDSAAAKDSAGGNALSCTLRDFVQANFQFKVVWDEVAITTNGDIRAFMDTLATGTNVIFVLTPTFFESPFCMYELAMTAKKGDLAARTFAVLSHGMRLDRDRIMDVVEHWIDIHARFKERIAKARKKNRKAVTPEMKDELAVLQTIATGASKALFHLQNKRWMQAREDGSIDEQELGVFIQRWVKMKKQPPFPWRKVWLGMGGIGLLVGLIFGIRYWMNNGIGPNQPLNADSLRLYSLYNDSILHERERLQKDSITKDSIDRLIASLSASERKAARLRVDSLVQEMARKAEAQRKEDAKKLKAARDSLAGGKASKPGQGNTGATTPDAKESSKDYTETAFGLEMKMVYVPGGKFNMGCTPEQGGTCGDAEKPAHEVTVDGYYIGVTEVTQRQWRAVMGNNPSGFKGCDDCPVEKVSWDDCQEFIKKLNNLTGERYRLPTEAEWEYAARGGQRSRGYRYAGGNDLGSVSWHQENSERKTHSVGKKAPNELGLFDMSGNVWEWCSDWYSESYYRASPLNNPQGPRNGIHRVVRGGSWYHASSDNQVLIRMHNPPETSYQDGGFRVVR